MLRVVLQRDCALDGVRAAAAVGGERGDAGAAGGRVLGARGHRRGAAAHDDEIVSARAGQAFRKVFTGPLLAGMVVRRLAFADALAEPVGRNSEAYCAAI